MNEREVLKGVQVVGYANLAALLYGLFSLKEPGNWWVGVVIPGIVALAGTVFYYFGWHKWFHRVPRTEGRVFVRPYILGSALAISAVVLVLGLIWVGSRSD